MSPTPLTREQLLSTPSFRASRLVELDGMVLRIVGLSTAELARSNEAAAEAGNEEEASQRRLAVTLRYGVVDEHRRPIFESEEEATAFLDKLALGAAVALGSAVMDLTTAASPGKAPAPSSTTPSSSGSTTSPSSSDASPASSLTSPPASSPG